GDTGGAVVAAEVGRGLAVAAEGRVEDTVGEVAGNGEFVDGSGDMAGDDDPAVGLQGHAGQAVVAAEVGRGPAVAAEGRVGGAVGQEAGDDAVIGRPGGVPGGDDLAVGLHRDAREG